MIRLIALPFLAVLLMGALPACDRETIEHYSALVTGTPSVQFVALEQESNRAWEEVVVVEVVPEPEPPKPDCTPTLWRAVWTNPCTGETWTID